MHESALSPYNTQMERFGKRERIGSGPFSDVFQSSYNGKVVALKVCDPDDEKPPHNCRRELKILQSLKASAKNLESMHIVQILDSIFDGGILKIVMPLYYCDLDTVIQHCSRAKIILNPDADVLNGGGKEVSRINRLPLQRANQIINGIAVGLAHIHGMGIIHRDIKPSNVMFMSIDSEPILIDFGIAWSPHLSIKDEPENEKITDISSGIFKAPEVIFGCKNYTTAVDIWALGVLMMILYSKDCVAPFDRTANFSDISLISSIFSIFGKPNLGDWTEVANNEAISAFVLSEKGPEPPEKVLPRADDCVRSLFTKMMIYQSTLRISSAEIVKYFD